MDNRAEEAMGMNPYHFGNNNPVMFNDPSGAKAMAVKSAAGVSGWNLEWLTNNVGGLQNGGGDFLGIMGSNSAGGGDDGGGGGGGSWSSSGSSSGDYTNYWNNFLDMATIFLNSGNPDGNKKKYDVVLIGGADLFSQGASSDLSTLEAGVDWHNVESIKSIDFNYWTEGLLTSTVDEETKELTQDYKVGDGIIIYGYSRGADASLQLAQSLDDKNVNIDLLITVDAADGPFNGNVDRSIPSNVKLNDNWYQTTPSSIGSHGDPNYRGADNNSTIINNYLMFGPTVNHGNMMNLTIPYALQAINDILNQ